MLVPVFEITNRESFTELVESIGDFIPDEVVKEVVIPFGIKGKYLLLTPPQDILFSSNVDMSFILYYALKEGILKHSFFVYSDSFKSVPEHLNRILLGVTTQLESNSKSVDVYTDDNSQSVSVEGFEIPIFFSLDNEYDFTEGKVLDFTAYIMYGVTKDRLKAFSKEYQSKLVDKMSPTTGYNVKGVLVKVKGDDWNIIDNIWDSIEFKPTIENQILYNFNKLWPNNLITIEYSNDSMVLKPLGASDGVDLYKFFDERIQAKFHKELEVTDFHRLLSWNLPALPQHTRFVSFSVDKLLSHKTGLSVENSYELLYNGVPLFTTFETGDNLMLGLNSAPVTLYWLTLAHSVLYENHLDVPPSIRVKWTNYHDKVKFLVGDKFIVSVGLPEKTWMMNCVSYSTTNNDWVRTSLFNIVDIFDGVFVLRST